MGAETEGIPPSCQHHSTREILLLQAARAGAGNEKAERGQEPREGGKGSSLGSRGRTRAPHRAGRCPLTPIPLCVRPPEPAYLPVPQADDALHQEPSWPRRAQFHLGEVLPEAKAEKDRGFSGRDCGHWRRMGSPGLAGDQLPLCAQFRASPGSPGELRAAPPSLAPGRPAPAAAAAAWNPGGARARGGGWRGASGTFRGSPRCTRAQGREERGVHFGEAGCRSPALGWLERCKG